MSQHARYKYSVTIKTDDLAVLHCLRALSAYAQITGNTRIPWGGTKKSDWERDNHHVTFHFSKPEYRESFIKEVFRLLPKESWEEVSQSNNDPATSQLK
jgi:hypothetical protein